MPGNQIIKKTYSCLAGTDCLAQKDKAAGLGAGGLVVACRGCFRRGYVVRGSGLGPGRTPGQEGGPAASVCRALLPNVPPWLGLACWSAAVAVRDKKLADKKHIVKYYS